MFIEFNANQKKKYLTAAGITVGAALVAAASAYLTTKLLMQIAIERKGPVGMDKAEKVIANVAENDDFMKERMAAADKLLNTPHEVVEQEAFDGVRLVGHWFKNPEARRIVVAFHGWRSGWNDDFGLVHDQFYNNGCSVLYAEQRGQRQSGGDYMGFGLTERFDAKTWSDYLAENTDNSLPIYLCGVSMGATTVLMADGLELSPRVHGIIADCGFTSPHDIWKHVVQDNLHMLFGVRGRIADEIMRRKISQESSYSTLEALKNGTRPVLFIHGADDHFVPVEMTYRNYMACTAPKKLLIVPGADHGMSFPTETDRYVSAVKEFWNEFDATVPDTAADITAETETAPEAEDKEGGTIQA